MRSRVWLFVVLCLDHAGGAAGSAWCRPNAGRCNGQRITFLVAANPFQDIDETGPASPEAVDWDGDGHLDLLVGNGDGQVRFFKGAQDGSLAANSFQAVGAGSFAKPKAVDWDGDGHLDLLVGGADGQVRFFKGAQDGSLAEADAAASPMRSWNGTEPSGSQVIIDVGDGASPDVVDWDGDGHLDLLVGNTGGQVKFFRGAQDGSLVDAAEGASSAAALAAASASGRANPLHAINVATAARPRALDWDGDGHLDLLVGNDGGQVRFFKGAQGGSLAEPSGPFQAAGVGSVASLEVVDWDGDGHLDLLVGNTDGQVKFLKGARDASLKAASTRANPFQAIDVGDYAMPEVVDWDGDGHLDLIVGGCHDEGSVRFYKGAQDGSLAANPFLSRVGFDSNCTSPEAADWDGDGHLDLLVGIDDGRVLFLKGAQDGSLAETSAAAAIVAVDGGQGMTPEVVDWDGDGHLDLLVRSGFGVKFFKGAQDGSLTELDGAANPFQAVGAGSDAKAVDWDGDGHLDLVAGTREGEVKFFKGAQDGSLAELGGAANPFQAVHVAGVSFLGFGWASPQVVDWDGDGHLDLVVGDADGQVKFFSTGCEVARPCSSPHGVCGPVPHACQCREGYDLTDCSGCAAGFYTDWNSSSALQPRRCRACPRSSTSAVCWGRGRCRDDVSERQARGGTPSYWDRRAGGTGTCECNPYFHGMDQEGRTTCEQGECPPAHHYTLSPSTQLYECQRCPDGHGKVGSGNELPCSPCHSYELWDGLCTPCDHTAAQVPSADRLSCVHCGSGEIPTADGGRCRSCGFGYAPSDDRTQCDATWPIVVVPLICVAFVAVCAIVLCWICRRRAKQRRQDAQQRIEFSENLGISLFYVLHSFESRLRLAIDLVEWRVNPSDGKAYTLGSFAQLYGGSADSPPREWREAAESAAPEDPDFVQMAPVMAYGRFAEGHGKLCPRDGKMDCSIVDGVLGEGSSGKANKFVSWVWTYKLSTARGAWRVWESAQHKADQAFDPRGTFLWWCFFTNNQFRVMQDRSKKSTECLAEELEARLKSIGTMHIMVDSLMNPAYAKRIWCIFEVLVASRCGISCSVILPEEQFAKADGIGAIRDLLKLTQVDAATARASEPDDEHGLKGIITDTQGSFREVNRKVQSSLCTPIIETVLALKASGPSASPSKSTSTLHRSGAWEKVILGA